MSVILQAGFDYRLNLSYITSSFKKEIEEVGAGETAGMLKFRVVCFRSLMEMKVNICINGNMLFLHCTSHKTRQPFGINEKQQFFPGRRQLNFCKVRFQLNTIQGPIVMYAFVCTLEIS